MNLFFLILEFAVVSIFLLTAVRIGRVAVICIVAAMQFLQTMVSATFYWELSHGLLVSPGTSIFFASNIAILLYVYIRAGTNAARSVFYAILGSNLFVICMTTVLGLHARFVEPTNLLGVPVEIFSLGIDVSLIGSVILLATQLVALATYNLLSNRGVPVVIAMPAALVVSLVFDTFGFITPVFWNEPEFGSILISTLAGKAAGGLGFGLVWGGLLQWRGAGQATPLPELFRSLSYAREGGFSAALGRYDTWETTSSLDPGEWFSGLSSGVCVTDGGRIVLANQRLAMFLGVSDPRQLDGDLLTDWLAAPVVLRLAKQVEADKISAAAQAHELPDDPLERRFETSAFPFYLNGRDTIVFVTNDVTDQLALRNRLNDSKQAAAVGTLAAGLAHEVNNPLTLIIANQDIALELLDELSTEDESRARAIRDLGDVLEDARLGATRVKAIIAQLMEFSRVDKADFEPLFLNEIVSRCLERMGEEIEAVARLEADLADVPCAMGSAQRLGQVIDSLLLNAVQAVEGQANGVEQIKVRVFERATSVIVEVSDSGPGVAEGIRDRIMEPFFTTRPLGEGTGLGLSASKSAIEAHGGTLEFETTLGAGSTFRVELPAGCDDEVNLPAPHGLREVS